MICKLFDRQHAGPEANGVTIETAEQLEAKLRALESETPFIVELVSPTGDKLTMGVGGALSFVQYTGASGLPPYLCAVGDEKKGNRDVEFLIGDTPTPIPARFCIPFETALKIAKVFCTTGKIPDDVQWESV